MGRDGPDTMARLEGDQPASSEPPDVTVGGLVLLWESGHLGAEQLALSLRGEAVEEAVQQRDLAADGVEPPVGGVDGAPDERVGG